VAARREQPDLGRAEQRAGRHHHAAFGHVAAGPPDGMPGRRRLVYRHALVAAVGPFHRHDGVGAGRHQRAGHDPGAGAGGDREGAGVASRDLVGHRQGDRRAGGRPRDVTGVDRVAVHRRVVEGRQRAQRGGVLGENATLGLFEPQPDRGQRPDRREDVGQVGLDRHQVSAHPRLSRYLRSQGTNSAATSGRSHAN
jgi:hypothetical protein